jgi:hypothetical protein
MITRETKALVSALATEVAATDSPPALKAVFMVEPSNFRLSEDSGLDNQYMDYSSPTDPDLALKQSKGLRNLIKQAGIEVVSFAGDCRTPDSIFPNNAFATSAGRFIVGHMYHPSRTIETERKDIRSYFHKLGYQTIDLSVEDCVAELTGTLIIDRKRRLGFCGMSNRVNAAGLKAMHEAFDLRHTLEFDLAPGEYHSNVVMSVLSGRACVIHAESIVSDTLVPFLNLLYDGKVLSLDQAEKDAFAGNCIALSKTDLFMSSRARNALRDSSYELLRSWGFKSTVLN